MIEDAVIISYLAVVVVIVVAVYGLFVAADSEWEQDK